MVRMTNPKKVWAIHDVVLRQSDLLLRVLEGCYQANRLKIGHANGQTARGCQPAARTRLGMSRVDTLMRPLPSAQPSCKIKRLVQHHRQPIQHLLLNRSILCPQGGFAHYA